MTNAEARFNNSLRPRKPEGSVGRTAQDGHLDFHTAPELWSLAEREGIYIYIYTATGNWKDPLWTEGHWGRREGPTGRAINVWVHEGLCMVVELPCKLTWASG